MLVDRHEMKMERIRNGHIIWCCTQKEKRKCKARARSYGTKLTIVHSLHNHPPINKHVNYELIPKRFKIEYQDNHDTPKASKSGGAAEDSAWSLKIGNTVVLKGKDDPEGEPRNKCKPNILRKKEALKVLTEEGEFSALIGDSQSFINVIKVDDAKSDEILERTKLLMDSMNSDSIVIEILDDKDAGPDQSRGFLNVLK